ncbi:DUF2321 domain-containing protein [Fictibacillus enclensis]|uniref:DUF2321 domain-containing protein n=1 Tax=Fictibacillus enclensis TaxID=1017270 RepID=UPI0025A1DA35|nr:DUF2321 domain-containing protein [Fictibacillus enclensis]MDM5335727.1 DUF2321 domain-containing protein [Fictibacillus enclensis]
MFFIGRNWSPLVEFLADKGVKLLRREQDWYDIAQVCINGHTSNDTYIAHPIYNKDFCDKCGEKTITACPKCKENIRGDHHSPGVVAIGFGYTPPNYCHKCGNPFPWTSEKLDAAKELAELLDELSDVEKEQLKMSLDELVKDGPRTVVATTRFKGIMSKTGPEMAIGFKDILIDLVSETVKKSIWG